MKKVTPRHTIIEVLKSGDKQKLKSSWGWRWWRRHVTNQEIKIRATTYVLSEVMWEDRGPTPLNYWEKIQPIILYPAKIFLKVKNEIKTFQTFKYWKNSSTADPHYIAVYKKSFTKKKRDVKWLWCSISRIKENQTLKFQGLQYFQTHLNEGISTPIMKPDLDIRRIENYVKTKTHV